MTKKDYIVISNALSLSQASIAKIEIVNSLCAYLKDQNPRFDEIKFKKSCQYRYQNIMYDVAIPSK